MYSISATAQDAKTLLDQVSKKVRSYDNIVLDFKYALKNTSENINQETRGDVSLKGEKYVLNMMGTTQLYDGKKLYTIIHEDEEINVASQNAGDEDSFTPSKMMTFYESGYNYKMDIKQNVKGRTIQFVKLIPISPKDDVQEILLGVDDQTNHIYKMIRKQKNGTQITITVSSMKTNQPLSETLFVFDKNKYSGYYINDLD